MLPLRGRQLSTEELAAFCLLPANNRPGVRETGYIQLDAHADGLSATFFSVPALGTE